MKAALLFLFIPLISGAWSGALVDWQTSQWLSVVDFTLRAVLSPQGLYGIDKIIDFATNGTGALILNVSALNLTWHIEHTNFTLETIKLGELDTIGGLEILQPRGPYGLSSGLSLNASLSANLTVNQTGWLTFRAQTQALGVAVTAIVEAYEDELQAMKENQVLFSRCWNRTLEALFLSELDFNITTISSLTVAASSWPVEVRVINALLKELVKNGLFQHVVQLVLEAEARKIQEGVNEGIGRLLANSSAPACPPPLDRSSVDENLASAFTYLPFIILGVLVVYGVLAVVMARDKTRLSLRVSYSRKHSPRRVILFNVLLAVAMVAQLYALQVAISTVSLDATVCEYSGCVPYPVVEMPIEHFSFAALVRALWDSGAGLLVFAMFVCFCAMPLGIQTCLFAVWWVPLSEKWLCSRRYVVAMMTQTCKLCLSTMIFQVYMICVLGSSSKMVLDDQSSYLQIKIQGSAEFAMHAAIFANLLTWALCYATRRAHDDIWCRQEVDPECCRSRRMSKRSPRVLIAGMLLGTTLAAVMFGLAFGPNMVTFTTSGLLGIAESGDAPEGYVTHITLLSLASRVTELTPEANSKTVVIICGVYYLTVILAPALTLALLFVIWVTAWRTAPSRSKALVQHGADCTESAELTEGQKWRLEALFLCSSLAVVDGLVAVTASAAGQMHLLFTEVVGGRLPFVCSLWTSLTQSACVGLVGEFEAGGYWVAFSWGLILILSVATEYCFVFSGALGLGTAKSGYLPISTD